MVNPDHSVISLRALTLKSNILRELLSLTERPGIISFAGGLPGPETFLKKPEYLEIASEAIDRWGEKFYQYGETAGFKPLRKILVPFLQEQLVNINSHENIIITTGSQQLLSLAAAALINEGDNVGVEAPTYIGGLTAFDLFLPNYIDLPTDEDGVIPEKLEKIHKKYPLKLIYVIPNFQNPTGRTMPLERRQEMADFANRYGIYIIEDDPYNRTRFEGEKLPSIQSLAPDRVIYGFSFSKIFAPGFRLGGAVAPLLIQEYLLKIKQGHDLFSPANNQAMLAVYLEKSDNKPSYFDNQITLIRDIYSERCQIMLEEMGNSFPDDYSWSHPKGGLFLWTYPKAGGRPRDMNKIFELALQQNVAFVPGEPFFANGGGEGTGRLNFSNQTPFNIRYGIPIIGELLKNN